MYIFSSKEEWREWIEGIVDAQFGASVACSYKILDKDGKVTRMLVETRMLGFLKFTIPENEWPKKWPWEIKRDKWKMALAQAQKDMEEKLSMTHEEFEKLCAKMVTVEYTIRVMYYHPNHVSGSVYAQMFILEPNAAETNYIAEAKNEMGSIPAILQKMVAAIESREASRAGMNARNG